MKTLSIVMIVRNEEKVLGRCLESIKNLVDEIIVVDTGSKDTTKEIATSFGAKIYDYEWNDSFSDARNYALEQATSDWNLVLDSDEYLSNESADEIHNFINNNNNTIGRVKRIDKFKDKAGDSFAQTFISRLFPRNLRYKGKIHEQIDSSLPRVKLSVEVQHDGYYNQSRSERNIPLLLHEIKVAPQEAYYHYQIAKEYRGLEKHELSYHHLKQAYSYIDKTTSYYPNTIVDYIYAGMASGELDEILQVINDENNRLSDFADYQFASALYYLEIIMKNTNKYVHLLPEIEICYQKCLQIGETDKYDSVMGTGSFSALHNLGVFYEVTGQTTKAIECYKKAIEYDYKPSLQRLQNY
ncbi:glycosyltransferase [Paenibacillus paridis]|uniref:glycosyltransferase n=1 Tax=Paenibacillus paridis TaxID=2583376 RepID=UPI00111CCDBB|nr:glycosyltransferase [Paenibacillus paridis]